MTALVLDESRRTLEGLSAQGMEEVEVYHKRGSSRCYRSGADSVSISIHDEQGHAIRAGNSRQSFFAAATGAPSPVTVSPSTIGRSLRLPSPSPVLRWSPPVDLDERLLGEGEARSLVEALAAALDNEHHGATIVGCCLSDGTSESTLVNSRGLTAHSRQRTGSVFVEARVGAARATSLTATRSLRQLDPIRVARHLADRLMLAVRAEAVREERGHCLLAPAVTATLLNGLRPLWLGPNANTRAAELTDRRGRLACPELTVIDDPRLDGGLLSVPSDAEGVPTRRITLVEEGRYRQPLLAWWQTRTPTQRSSGCSLRASWRDLPRPAPSQLFIRPDPEVGAADLLSEVRRGFYVIEVEGRARVSSDGTRFAIPVSGYLIGNGTAFGCFVEAWLSGSVKAFLHGIMGVGRDLRFYPHGDSLFGAPSLLIRGLRLADRSFVKPTARPLR